MSEENFLELDRTIAEIVLARLYPGASTVKIETPAGSFSNYTHLLHARTTSGSVLPLIIRRYRIFGDYDRGEKARREFSTYRRLREHNFPCPEPLLLDETGELLGMPGIVTPAMPGEQVYEPKDPDAWARELAATLARIHAIPCDPARDDFLLDSDAEISWFARTDSPPNYMKRHPEGERVWRVFREHFPGRAAGRAGLVHIDYWAGNILWKNEKISAVLDWEEAAYGDTAYDVAYSLLDIHMLGYAAVERTFLESYEAQAGQPVENLALWKLAASVRPMFGWGEEIYESPARERHHAYIAGAFKHF